MFSSLVLSGTLEPLLGVCYFPSIFGSALSACSRFRLDLRLSWPVPWPTSSHPTLLSAQILDAQSPSAGRSDFGHLLDCSEESRMGPHSGSRKWIRRVFPCHPLAYSSLWYPRLDSHLSASPFPFWNRTRNGYPNPIPCLLLYT